MNSWFLTRNRDLILFALKKGKFPERLLAIETLNKLNDKKSIPYLLKTAEKDYKEIAYKAIAAVNNLDNEKVYTKEIDTIDNLLDDKAEINLYRTIQEAFNNIVKHSEATAAKITIQKADKSLIINMQWSFCIAHCTML